MPKISDRVFIIGAGKVGRGLSRAFRASGVTVVGLHGRRQNEETTSVGELPRAIADANVVIIAVRDAEIEGVAAQLAAAKASTKASKRTTGMGVLTPGTIVLHTSGTAAPASYTALRAMDVRAGTFHPLVPFATPERGAALLRNAWFGIDGDADACAASRRLAAALGARTINIPQSRKAQYHAAAVIASNFPVVLAALASELLTDADVEPQAARQVVYSLMHAAVENFEHVAPRDALTGPAVRGDAQTVEAHLTALASWPHIEAVYRAITRAITGKPERPTR